MSSAYIVRVSPKPISKSSMLDPESMNRPRREIDTASQVDGEGLPFRLKEGMHRAKIGVRNISKPAMKPTFEADEVAIPLQSKYQNLKCVGSFRNYLTIVGIPSRRN
jgi:hypothetical protein